MEKPHVSKRSEDLLEAILEISSEKGYAKSRDIAAALQITPATVTDGFKRLAAAGLVHYEPYGGVTLTKNGNVIAKRTRECHQVIRRLLLYAGVGEDIADRDACIMEHGLSPESYEQLRRVVLFLEECLKDEDIILLFERIVFEGRKKT
ncbi:MAG: metal-dependent transcriptional regulator [Methanospirillaceae archaeon]|nr:metal-dependent transcriptional regulator [Methanospirillaceae archaeon]